MSQAPAPFETKPFLAKIPLVLKRHAAPCLIYVVFTAAFLLLTLGLPDLLKASLIGAYLLSTVILVAILISHRDH